MKGDAKLIDECHSPRRSPFYALVKHNVIFSMMNLCRLVNARHGGMPAGKWVVITAPTYDVKIMAT